MEQRVQLTTQADSNYNLNNEFMNVDCLKLFYN